MQNQASSLAQVVSIFKLKDGYELPAQTASSNAMPARPAP